MLAALLPLLLADYRSPAARRALVWGMGGALAGRRGMAGVSGRAADSVGAAHSICSAGWTPTACVPAITSGILGWYAWPAWPLAAWAVYRGAAAMAHAGHRAAGWRRWLGLLGLYAFDAHPGEEQGLILLLPLALLGAAGLFTLRRGAANALLWFA